MGHMGFTDICRVPVAQLVPTLRHMCDPERFIDIDRGWTIIRPFVTAWVRRYLEDDAAMEAWLTGEFAAGFDEAGFEAAR